MDFFRIFDTIFVIDIISDYNNINKNITNYLYGSILYDDFQHNLAVNNLRKNSKLQGQHSDYDIKYVTSLIIDGRFDEAEQYISSLKKSYSDVFIFNFLKSIFYLQNKEYEKALQQIKKVKIQTPNRTISCCFVDAFKNH